MKKDPNASLRRAIQEIAVNALAEDAPEAGRVDSAIMDQQLKVALGSAVLETARMGLDDLEEMVFELAADIVNQHNMTDTEFDRVDGRTLRHQVEDFEDSAGDGDLRQLHQETLNAIESAMNDYAAQLSQYIVHVIGPSAR